MKRLLGIFAVLTAFTSAHAQEAISDSILYSLTLRTIENFTCDEEIRVLESVTIPVALWDKKIKRLRTGRYFKTVDLAFIKQQIKNPAITSWDNEKFKRARNIRVVKHLSTLRRRNYLFVSLPIFSKDLRTVVIYYETWNKSLGTEDYGAGFAAVWKLNQNNKWIQSGENKLWVAGSDQFHPDKVDTTTAGIHLAKK
jgi:hypothetical protein